MARSKLYYAVLVCVQCAMASLIPPLQQLLDKSCTTIFYKSIELAKDLQSDDSNAESPGYLALDGTKTKWTLFDRIRSTWPCFDVLTTTVQSANEITDPVFEARNTRYIYIGEETNVSRTVAANNQRVNSKAALMRQQTITLLEPSQSRSMKEGFDLWLLCPPEMTKAKMLIKKIDIFPSKHKLFVGTAHRERKSYRLCNKKGFYHGKSLTYTGTYEEGLSSLPLSIAKVMANKVGATYKFRHSWGCLFIKSELPQAHTTLGLLYLNKADLGGNVVLNTRINRQFDYIFYTYNEYFFVGPQPELLPQIKNISYPFDSMTWLFTYLSLLAAAILSLLIIFVHTRQIKLNPVLLIWGMTFMENHFSLYSQSPLSGVFIRKFWLVGITLLTMAYHGTLKASLTKRTFEKETVTHWDMLDKDLPVYAYFVGSLSGNGVKDYYAKMEAHILEKNTMIHYGETLAVLNRIFEGEKAFIFSSTGQEIQFQNIFIDKYGPDNYPMRRVKDSFDFSYGVLSVKKYVPQTEELKTVMDHLWSSGIPWHDTIKYSFYHGKTQPAGVLDEKIGMEHFLLLFVTLLASYILGFMSFMQENKKLAKKKMTKLHQVSKKKLIKIFMTFNN